MWPAPDTYIGTPFGRLIWKRPRFRSCARRWVDVARWRWCARPDLAIEEGSQRGEIKRSYHFVVERDPETNLLVGGLELRQRGSHKQLRHPDGRSATVLFLTVRNIALTLLRKIAADVRLTVDELLGSR